ncbi:hypothetical protein HMPREF1982_03092 [Clostridiales bacterium oral taxon 876 str. F0540]|nr:hypothetical protein HMPREF1982_03092 [Clostridiales bacterium oral taxon 876 str. F0540]
MNKLFKSAIKKSISKYSDLAIDKVEEKILEKTSLDLNKIKDIAILVKDKAFDSKKEELEETDLLKLENINLSPIQNQCDDDKLFGYEDNSGNLIIDYKFESAGTFSEGLASVKINGKFGYINKLGKLVIPARYEFCGTFSEGLAPVKLEGKCGYINNKNSMVIYPQFDFADAFKEGMAVIGKSITDIENPINKFAKFQRKDPLAAGMLGLMAMTNPTVLLLSAAIGSVTKDTKFGYIDKQGNIIIECKYDSAEAFEKNEAKVKSQDTTYKIDNQGNIINII